MFTVVFSSKTSTPPAVHGRILKCNCRPVRKAPSGLVAPLDDGDMLMDELSGKELFLLACGFL